MTDQLGLDFSRIDVHSPADDEVGAAIGEEEVAVGIDVAVVAEREVFVVDDLQRLVFR